MTKVKICGITNLEDALLSAKFGADALGFNFYEKSPRYISPEKAAEICRELPEDILKVGVFVNESKDKILETAAQVPLDAVQLHGDESPEFVRELKENFSGEIIKALRVSKDFQPEDALKFNVDAILLDAYSKKEYGGTGETFDWEIAKCVQEICPKMYLAGGLSQENIANAILEVKPFAVDACSCLEEAKGRKNHQNTQLFLEKAKSRHYLKPEISDISDDEFIEMHEKLVSTDYYKYASELLPLTKGKIVESSLSGNSGFLLNFADKSWVICFLDNDKLRWKFGANKFPDSHFALINNNKFGYGENRFSANLPYADEKCFIDEEIKKSYGKEVKGLSIGERNFSFCFPEKMELDVMLFPNDKGKLTLRVFWEQW